MNSHYPANIELMTKIGFTTQELEDNRNGRLSLKQQQKLRTIQKSWHSFSSLIKVISIILIIASILDGIRIGDTLASRIGILILICVIAAGALIYSELQTRNLRKDLSKGTVNCVEGEVKLKRYLSKTTGITYKIHIDQMKFEVSSAVFTAFSIDQKYRLYFPPHSKMLLSAEQII